MDTLTSPAPQATRRTRRVLLAGLALLGAGAGVLGAAGTADAAAPARWASVRADGVLQKGSGVSKVAKVSPGQYEVTFTADVRGCSYLATPRSTTAAQALLAYTSGGQSSPNGVFVEVKNQGGGLTDGAFSLNVVCAGSGVQHAVVGYKGELARSSGATVNKLETGVYELGFPTNISRCAYLATVGDPGSDVVYAPNNVSTRGATATSMVVETKNPAGGLSDGIPFHVGVICPDTGNGIVSVTGANGIPARSSARTSSFRASTGNHTLVGPQAMSTCAVVATRGDVGTAAPFTPATVESVPTSSSNTAGVKVRQLLHFGGAAIDQSYHAVVLC